MNDYPYGIELGGWLAALEGGASFGPLVTTRDVLEARVLTLRADVAALEELGAENTVGLQAARDLLALLEKGLESLGA